MIPLEQPLTPLVPIYDANRTLAPHGIIMSTSTASTANIVRMGWGDFPVTMENYHQHYHDELLHATHSPAVPCNPIHHYNKLPSPPPSSTTIRSSVVVETFGWSDFPPVLETTTLNNKITTAKAAAESASQRCGRGSLTNYNLSPPVLLQTKSLQTKQTNGAAVAAMLATPQSQQRQRKRIVRFGIVRIREYDTVLGDHPLCPSYPVTLGWTYNADEKVVDISQDDDDDDDTSYDFYFRASLGNNRRYALRRSCPMLPLGERRLRLVMGMGVSLVQLDHLEQERQLGTAETNDHGDDRDGDDDNGSDELVSISPHMTDNLVRMNSNSNRDLSVLELTNNAHIATAASCSGSSAAAAVAANDGCNSRPQHPQSQDLCLDSSCTEIDHHNNHSDFYKTVGLSFYHAAAENFLEMNMHINSHAAVHPGFEIQIY